jgi:hypothetical protein
MNECQRIPLAVSLHLRTLTVSLADESTTVYLHEQNDMTSSVLNTKVCGKPPWRGPVCGEMELLDKRDADSFEMERKRRFGVGAREVGSVSGKVRHSPSTP